MRTIKQAVVAALLAGSVACAHADIKIGVTLCLTGPAASLGIPVKNGLALLPTEIGGEKLQWIILDDASDPTSASKNARKLTGEERVDLLVGSNITPNTLAVLEVAAESQTPAVAIAGASMLVTPMDAKRRWMFKVPQNENLMAKAIFEHMARNGVKTAGYIGFNDGYGESWWKEAQAAAEASNIKLAVSERYGKTDTSVTGQILKIQAANPDAVLIGGAGTPAALPQLALKQRGYAGKIYQTHGVANNDFLRVGGKDLEGTLLPSGPILVLDQLPDSNPSKKQGKEFVAAHDAKHGPGTANAFGAYSWDLGLWLKQAVPVALKSGKPGTKEFRAALRDAFESMKNVVGSHGTYNLTPQDHNGLDGRGKVMVTIQGGAWKFVE
ncbi:ABC transporter substrate-binding protein [Sulfuritalea sp.]|uniref:ABC transporter substrate-binding protein n=1 Tax=Sulfuritalea sp. TaxID=2480090 RepID=UPI001ACEB6D8|nr:ABC transporter substrate-binding protein [Sulfuritalea sp.]MBN8477103.1 ABC transporter substrate-binding protein [Sulfuritalea sp.]